MSPIAPVVVTGATGFVASHLIRALLMRGHKVRGTMRNVNDKKKVGEVQSICPEHSQNLELVQADLLDEDCWPKVIRGVEHVYHVASPLPMANPKHEDLIIKPAVNGTLNVLKASRDSGSVKRVVVTSTIGTIMDVEHANRILDEKHWAPEDNDSYYIKSKILAEKAAWRFMKELGRNPPFELAVLNPGYIIGPVFYNQPNTIGGLIQQLMERKTPRVPQLYVFPIDVRKLAEMHIAAMTVPKAAGHRHIVIENQLWMSDMAKALDEEFRPMGYDVPTKDMPNWFLKLVSIFSAETRTIVPLLGVKFTYDNSRAQRILGLKPGDIRECVVETAHSMIAQGMINRTPKYTPPKNS